MLILFVLQYTFPFEGNWNDEVTIDLEPCGDLQYTFPFEGNWNFKSVPLTAIEV